MGQTTERELKIQKDKDLVDDFIRRAQSDFGEKNVTYFKGTDASSLILIKNSDTSISRKEHTLPEHLRKNGD